MRSAHRRYWLLRQHRHSLGLPNRNTRLYLTRPHHGRYLCPFLQKRSTLAHILRRRHRHPIRRLETLQGHPRPFRSPPLSTYDPRPIDGHFASSRVSYSKHQSRTLLTLLYVSISVAQNRGGVSACSCFIRLYIAVALRVHTRTITPHPRLEPRGERPYPARVYQTEANQGSSCSIDRFNVL